MGPHETNSLDFKPRATGVYDAQGKLVSSSQRAKTFADYLANTVWHSAADPTVPVHNPYPPVSENRRAFYYARP